MADVATTAPRKRTFRKFSYRGVDLDALLDLSSEQLMELVPARVRRKFSRGLNRKSMALIKKLRKAKKECPEFEKPAPVKTHLRNMIIVPEMIGSVVGVYNGKVFNQVEIKPDMVSHYLGGKFVVFEWGGTGMAGVEPVSRCPGGMRVCRRIGRSQYRHSCALRGVQSDVRRRQCNVLKCVGSAGSSSETAALVLVFWPSN